MGSGYIVGWSSSLLIVFSAVLSSNSFTGFREMRCWLLACKAMNSRSIGVLVDSLKDTRHGPLYCT